MSRTAVEWSTIYLCREECLSFRPAAAATSHQIRTIAGPQTQLADPLFIALPPGAVVPTPVPVMLKISPTSLNFGTIEIGKRTRPKPIIVSNPKGGKKRHGLTVTMQEVGGGISPFSETDDCDAPLRQGRCARSKFRSCRLRQDRKAKL